MKNYYYEIYHLNVPLTEKYIIYSMYLGIKKSVDDFLTFSEFLTVTIVIRIFNNCFYYIDYKGS